MRTMLGAVCLCLWFCPGASAASDDSQFRPLLAAFLDGWNKHDPHAFAAIFATDAVVTTVGGNRVEGREALETYMRPSFTGPMFKDSVYSAEIKTARQIGPDIAVLDLDWEMTGARNRDGAPRPHRKGTLNWVVVKKDGHWEITSYHNSEFPQPSTTQPK
jgi:uncharacterized protein (TIGR02246 family)